MAYESKLRSAESGALRRPFQASVSVCMKLTRQKEREQASASLIAMATIQADRERERKRALHKKYNRLAWHAGATKVEARFLSKIAPKDGFGSRDTLDAAQSTLSSTQQRQ